MEISSRLFNCLRCHIQVFICRHCDRGNVYCSSNCALAARKKSLRAAGLRYQQTMQGKRKHAQRQYRYRQREIKKVTHHGSIQEGITTDSNPVKKQSDKVLALTRDYYCNFCGKRIASFFRPSFLRHSIGRQRSIISALPRGP